MLIVLFTVAVVVLLFAIFYGLVVKFVLPKKKFNARLRSIDTQDLYGDRFENVKTHKLNEELSFRERVIIPLEKSIGSFLLNFAPDAFMANTEKLLLVAGKRKVWSVQGFTFFRGVFLLFSVLLAIYYVMNAPEMSFAKSAIVVLVGFIFGAMAPLLFLRSLAQSRQKKITKQLPEVFDLLCVSVQAGLSFDAAIRRIVEHMEGPFIDEFRIYIDDMRMGLPRRIALKQMSERCDVPEVSLFATSLIQADRLGSGIGRTLTNQSANMRDRRRQQVKAQAMKAPVKMLFPLVIFIFPAIFVVVLLPPLLGLIKNLAR